jgi:hypothetical protein
LLTENPILEKSNEKTGPSLAGGIFNLNSRLKKDFNEE